MLKARAFYKGPKRAESEAWLQARRSVLTSEARFAGFAC
jgi:hypothetical protein